VFSITPRDGGGLSLTLDLPRAPDTRRSFEAMARLANHLASACGGSLVDDNGNVLGEPALEAIAAQLDQVREMLEARGIVPGGALAVRLFS
jgi:FtsZ-interacting cell division protein ZipA